MKFLFSTVIMWTVIFMPTTDGQDLNQRLDIYNQKLNVYHQNEIVAIVSGQNIHDIKEANQWRKLLTSFQENLKSVKDEIPEYLIYKIEYQKNYNLIVEEVEGIVRYKVNNGQTNFDSKQSIAILSDQNFYIQLNFGKLDDLISMDYELMIESAMTNLGKKPGTLKHVYFPKYKYDYSFSKKEMINEKVKNKLKFLFAINGTVGMFKASPIYEANYGIGFSLRKEDNSRYQLFYIYYGFMNQFNRQIDRVELQTLWGLAWKTKRAGTFSIGFPSLKLDDSFEEFDWRIGVTFHTKNNRAISINTYMGDTLPLYSLTFGFSF